MSVRLTESAIAKAAKDVAATEQRTDLVDAGCPGLRLRLTPAGSKSWVLSCRDREGRMRRYPLGAFPAIGISEARDAARSLHVKVKQDGADPVAERRRERSIAKDAKAGINTLASLLTLYGSNRGRKLKSWDECQRRIESVFVKHLDRALATMKLGDLQLAADTWPSKQSASAAVRYLRPILKWAAHRRYVSPDLATIAPPAAVGRRDRVLSCDELAKVLPTLEKSDRAYGAALRFLLLTLARREEVATARWRDVNLEAATWTISETKNGQPHLVPLSHQAVDLLRKRLPRDKDDKPMKAAPDSLLFATATGGLLGNWDRETKAIMVDSGTGGWTRHDLRRTGATMLGEMGELPDIIEAALNHVAIRSQLAATYNRSRYRPQVAAALQRLADALDEIEADAAKIVQMQRVVG
jgi:integrase